MDCSLQKLYGADTHTRLQKLLAQWGSIFIDSCGSFKSHNVCRAYMMEVPFFCFCFYHSDDCFCLQELLYPVIELVSRFQILASWEDPYKSMVFLVMIGYIIIR